MIYATNALQIVEKMNCQRNYMGIEMAIQTSRGNTVER